MSVSPTTRTISGERSYQKLLENIGDSVSVVDIAGRALWTTSAIRSDLGYDGNFWEGVDLLSLVHPGDTSDIQGLLAKLLVEPGVPVSGETRLRRPDGGYSYVGFTARNRLDDPDIGGIVIASRSVDSAVEWRKSQESYQQDLQDAAAGQSRFIAGIGHEIRTPLHVISGLSELLASDAELSAAAKRHVETIGRETVALRRIIDDLLDFSKMSAGHMELAHEPFSPAGVGDAAVASLRTLAEEKGLMLRAAVDPAVPRLVLGDEFRVRQVLVNLLSNAVKYTETGSVQLEVSSQPAGHVQFSVTDTGSGIPEDALETLFEPYKQARLADEQKGTGLGLAICSRLVALMGSKLEVQTGPEGSRFWCEVEFEQARRSTDSPAASTQSTGSGQILVVDDSEVNRMLASAQLERLGYSPITVSSGREALDYLAEHSVSAVLMDWHMPEMDGLEATRTLRGSPDIDPSLPVIAMTASAMSGDRETCLAAGMNDYLAKPVSIDDLAASLASWVDDTPSEVGASSTPEISSNETIEQLVDELGDRELVASVVKTFLEELPVWKEELVAASDREDFVAARRAAHTMKSTAAMLGANELASRCAEFESTVLEDPPAALAIMDDLMQNLDHADRDLRRVYGSLTDTAL